MKINWKYLKKPPVIIGSIILFFIVLWMVNRGASSSTTSSGTITNGVSDAQLAASTQLGLASISAGVANAQTAAQLQAIQENGDIAVALKTIDAAGVAQQTAAQQAIAAMGIAAQIQGMQLSFQTSQSNNELSFNVAKMAYDNANYSIEANTSLQAHLSDDQLKAFTTSSIVSAIGSAKAGDRDQLTAALIGGTYGQSVTYGIPGHKGSVETGNSIPTGAITFAPPPLPQTSWVG